MAHHLVDETKQGCIWVLYGNYGSIRKGINESFALNW